MAKCVITGCSLVDPRYKTELNGDLFEQGDSWIFNRTSHVHIYDSKPSNPKFLSYDHSSHYFERRNVFVISKSESELSPAAVAYIGK